MPLTTATTQASYSSLFTFIFTTIIVRSEKLRHGVDLRLFVFFRRGGKIRRTVSRAFFLDTVMMGLGFAPRWQGAGPDREDLIMELLELGSCIPGLKSAAPGRAASVATLRFSLALNKCGLSDCSSAACKAVFFFFDI